MSEVCDPYSRGCLPTTVVTNDVKPVDITTTTAVAKPKACETCLPVTGADIIPIAILAVVVIAFGVALYLAVRLSNKPSKW